MGAGRPVPDMDIGGTGASMTDQIDREDTSRDDLILKEIQLTRDLLAEHSGVLQAIHRDLAVVRAAQQDQGSEMGKLASRVAALEMSSRDGSGSNLTPVPRLNPKLAGSES